jgi:hypothetical protein
MRAWLARLLAATAALLLALLAWLFALLRNP